MFQCTKRVYPSVVFFFVLLSLPPLVLLVIFKYLTKMALWRPFDVSDNEMDNVEAMAEPTDFFNKDLHVQTKRVILNIYTCLKSESRGA